MQLLFKTSLEGNDSEGIDFVEENHEAILAISLMLTPIFVGMIKSECRRRGIITPEET